MSFSISIIKSAMSHFQKKGLQKQKKRRKTGKNRKGNVNSYKPHQKFHFMSRPQTGKVWKSISFVQEKFLSHFVSFFNPTKPRLSNDFIYLLLVKRALPVDTVTLFLLEGCCLK